MFDQLKYRVRTWRRYRRVLSELELQSDRDLSELGFMRCDLPRIARETVKR